MKHHEIYEHQHYPKTLFHPDGRNIVVRDADAHISLGEEWAESPFPPATVEPAGQAPAPEVECAADQPCPNCVALTEKFNAAWDEQVSKLEAANKVIDELRAENKKQAKAIASLEKKVAKKGDDQPQQ